MLVRTARRFRQREIKRQVAVLQAARDTLEQQWSQYESINKRNELPNLEKMLNLTKTSHVVTLQAHAGLKNLFRSVHGGAIVSAMYQSGSHVTDAVPKSMHVQFLSPVNGKCTLEPIDSSIRSKEGHCQLRTVEIALTSGSHSRRVAATSTMTF